ncbi:alpha/beta hydrolase [Spirillospora sp. CA-294931]|uniref:alpha/beta hydrolase n=1 Tax=Spirillospora sp. CA-294931 TaxID=3240042 RepID=UPI003D8B40A9
MEPTSAGFIILVCALAAVAFAASLWLWPRLSGGGARPVLARSGLLVTCQLLLTAALVIVTNRYFVFYSTWNDLFGSDRVKVQVKQVQADRGKEADPADLVRRTTTDLGPKRKGHAREPQKDGRVDRLALRGARSGLDSEVFVYLPPQYFQPAFAHKRLPVVTLFSGGASDDRMAWLGQARLPDEAARAVASGRAHPAIYVMVRSARALVPADQPPAGPDADRGLPTDGHRPTAKPATCLNTPGVSGGQAELFFSQDLPVAVSDTYRVPATRKGWAVAGYGPSGQCALRLAMLRSDRFAAAASLDGTLDVPEPPPGGTTTDPYGGSKTFRQDNDLQWRLRHLPPPPVSVLLATAAGKPAETGRAAGFVALARPPMRAEKLVVPGAPGRLADWRPRLPAVLRWLTTQVHPE